MLNVHNDIIVVVVVLNYTCSKSLRILYAKTIFIAQHYQQKTCSISKHKCTSITPVIVKAFNP